MQTDKASMLDEIIDYIKFLQLQVKVPFAFLQTIDNDSWLYLTKSRLLKVLSTSRLEAVVPQLTDAQDEVLSKLLTFVF